MSDNKSRNTPPNVSGRPLPAETAGATFEQPAPHPWRRARQAVGWAAGVACLVYVVIYFTRHSGDLRLVLHLRPATLGVLVVLHSTQIMLRGLRYYLVLCKCGEARMPVRGWLRVYFVAQLLSQVFPQMGNVYRGVVLKSRFSLSYTDYIAGTFSFVWMDACLNFLIAMVVVWVLNPSLELAGVNGVLLLGVILAFAVVFPFLVQLVVTRVAPGWTRLTWARSKLTEVLRTTGENLRDVPYMAAFSGTGAIVFVVMCVVFYVYFKAMGADVTVSAIVLLAILLKVSMLVNITPGNLGLREVAYGILAEQLHLGMSAGILVSVIIRVISNVIIFTAALPLGGWDLLRQHKRSSILQHEAVDRSLT